MRHSRLFRAAATVVAAVCCAVGAAALVSRRLEVTDHVFLVLAVFSPLLMAAIPFGVVAFLAAGRRRVAAAAAVLALIALATQVPTSWGGPHQPDATALRVVSVNTLQGAADAGAVVRSAGAADVVSIQELTPQGLAALSANGIDDVLPFRIVNPLPGGSGAGLWSRHPLLESPAGEFEGVPIIARLDLRGAAAAGTKAAVTVAVVHLSAPWPWPIGWWRADIARATSVLSELSEGAVIAAGDFNSTRDMRQFRELLAAGYGSTNRSPTFPSGRRWPPLLAIDHILTRNCSSSAPKTVTVPGTDHRAVQTTVYVGAH